MSDDGIRYEGPDRKFEIKDHIIVKLTAVQMAEPAAGKNEVLYEESEIPNSTTWTSDMKLVVVHMPTIMATPGLFELVIRAGKPWVMKRFVTVREVLFPDGEMEIKDSPEKKG